MGSISGHSTFGKIWEKLGIRRDLFWNWSAWLRNCDILWSQLKNGINNRIQVPTKPINDLELIVSVLYYLVIVSPEC
jgi:hypothetical protein